MRKLKLFFACLLMAVFSIGQVWGADESVTFSEQGYTNQQEISSYSGTNFSIAFNKGTNSSNAPKYYTSGTAIRAYGGNYFTVSSSTKTIAEIELTFGGSDGSNAITTDVNTYSNGTWTGSATSVTFTIGGSSGNRRIAGIAVTYEAGCSSEVTITKGAETNGTYTLSAAKVCADGDGGEITISNITPATGYEFDEITTSASGTVDNTLKKVTGIKAATTITVKFKEKQKYTVTWNNSGVETTSQVYEGAKPEFPATPAACDASSTTFIGWATAPWDGKIANLSEKTVYTSADAMPAVSGAVTYYAVFAKVAGQSGWIETAIGDLTSSDVFVLADESGYALNNDGGTSNAPAANAITVSEGKITSAVADKLKWNISGNATNGYTFYPNGTTESWLYCNTTAATGSNNNMRVGTGDRKVFVVSASGYLVTNDANARYLSRYNTQDFRGYVNTDTNPVKPKCYKYSAGTASDYMTTCCTKYDISIADGITNGSISADLAAACEGATVTLTFTPAGGYHLDSWSVNGDDQDVNDNTFTMPAEDVEVSAAFAHDDCANLAAPTLDEITKSYNSATIAWYEVADAEEYAVSVVNHATSESVFAGNVDALSKALADLEPETQYDYSIMAVGDGTVKCADGNGVLAGNFTTEPLPTAHLTLIDPSGTHASSGDYAILTPFNLPTTAATCSKTFVGWDSNENCATAPTYAKGAEFTFANTTGVTLYAVYADVTGGGTSTTDIKCTVSTTTNMTGGNDADLLVDETDAADAGWIVTGYKGGGSNFPGLNKDGTIRLYYNASGNSYIDVTAPSTITSIEVTCKSGNDNIIVKVGDAPIALDDDVYPINATSFRIINGYTASTQVHIQNIAVNFTTPGTPSNYSTTCAAAPEVIIDPEEINATAAAVAAGVIEAAYDNVDKENIAVALYKDQACTEAFDGDWLTASINGDNNIAYSIAENTSYASDRKAYIKLTAPASSTGVAAATVVIPVTQAKKAAVFASLEELVASDAPANSNVTVSFSNVVIKEIYMYNSNRRGLTFNIQKEGHDIKIYFNADVPAAWAAGGKVSGTLTNCPWKIYSEAWQLAPASGWAWDNGDLTYTAPPAISSIEIRGTATAKTYIDGQAFNPAGLSVIAIYDNSDEEDVTAYATWTFDPEKLSESNTEVEVTAEYNDKSDTKAVDGLTVNPIPNKTIGEFIAAGGTRCYLEGTVGTIDNSTYGNFWLTDASGEIYVYGCLTSAGESGKFNTLGVSAGDKIKVIAEEYVLYQKVGDPDKDEAKNVVFVSKKSPATMTFNPMALEFGDVETMAPATITLADASDIEYSIKDGSDDCVTIAGDQITAKSVAGTATIVATLAETDDYVGATAEFAVTVSAPITKYAITFDGNGADGGDAPAAIVAQAENAEVTLPANTWTKDGCKFDGWKVINNSTSAEVSVAGGKFSMPASAVTIQAQWAEIPSWAYVYDNNVVVAHTGSGTDDGTITISETEYKLVKAGAGSNTGTIKVTVPAGATDLHFHAFAWGGKTAKIQIAGVENASISEFDLAGEAGAAGSGNDFTLQGVPVDQYYHVSFDAVADETEIVFSKANGSADNRFFFYGVNQEGGDFGSYQRSTTCGNYGTICLPYAGTISGATLFEIADYENDMIYCDEITDGKMIAGRPYIFYATSGSLNVAYTANVAAAAGNHNGLYGFYDLTDDEAIQDLTEDAGNYILYQNAYWLVSGRAAYIANYRAYIKIGMINYTAPLPGRRRVAMAVNGKQTPTDIDAINASEKPMKLMIDGQMFILRGEKMYNANGQVVK